MASLLGFLGALGDSLGVAGTSPQQPGALTRFNNAVDPVAAQERAQAQAEQSALAALASNRQQGITDPTANLRTIGQYVPQYTQAAAQAQAQNPLAAILQPTGGTGGGSGGGNGGGIPADLVGEDFLGALKAKAPSIANQVKAIAEGRQAPPSGYAMKSGYGQTMMALVSQYDPSFDQTNPLKRMQTAKSFAPGGKDRQNINAIETAINTLSLLNDTNEKLGDAGNWGPLSTTANSVKNAVLSGSGDTDLARYNKLAKDAADEVTKAIIANGGTGGDREERFKGFSANNTKDARKAVITASIDELMQRLNPVADSYNQAMGKSTPGIQLLTPQAQKAYAKTIGSAPQLTEATGNPAQDVTTNATDSAQQAPIIVNPKTGEKMTLQGGKWVPVK